MSSQTYKLNFRPLGKYFFGSEPYFDQEKDQVFYYQKSRDFPQQTTLLGVIRYQLLRQNGLLEPSNRGPKVQDEAKAAELIGAAGFNGTDQSFGHIQRLSPVHLEDKDGITWYPYWGQNNKAARTREFEFDRLEGKVALGPNDHRTWVPTLPKSDFNHKDGYAKGFSDPQGNFIPESHPFGTEKQKKELEQIGVYKNYRNLEAQEDQGFFKFQYRQLDPDFTFCCYLELDSSENITLDSCRVIMGKERSLFALEVEKVSAAAFPDNPTISAGDQVHLLSDTYVDSSIYQYCTAAITETLPFRNLRYELKQNPNYATTPKKSSKVLLLRRGSILCIRTADDAALQAQKLLDKANAYQKIGYNYYSTGGVGDS